MVVALRAVDAHPDNMRCDPAHVGLSRVRFFVDPAQWEGYTLFVFLAEHRGSAHGPLRHSTAILTAFRATANTPRATVNTPRASAEFPWASTECLGR